MTAAGEAKKRRPTQCRLLDHVPNTATQITFAGSDLPDHLFVAGSPRLRNDGRDSTFLNL
jgi:hypothetical protein